MDTFKHLDFLFNPQSVAVIGASSRFGKWGANVLALLLSKQGRRIYAVNNRESEVMGVKAYSSVKEVPGPVDFATITVPYKYVPDAMCDCVEKGVKTVLIISGGFGEVNEKGVRIEQEVLEIARSGGIRFVGPNCLGHFDTFTDFFTTPHVLPVRKGTVSIITQSGNSGAAIIRNGMRMGLGFSKFISSGNEADLRFVDFLEYLAHDDKTDVILGYIEGIREGRRFLDQAKEITKRKPIVIMKAGHTAAGAIAARSHTAALAGSDIISSAAFKQCGVIKVEELTELTDVAVALLGQPLPRGRRVGVVSMGGGIGVMAADALIDQGLELPKPSSSTIEKLDSILSGRWSHGNPVDPGGDFVGHTALWPLIEDDSFDSTLIICSAGIPETFLGLLGPANPKMPGIEKLKEFAEKRETEDLAKTFKLMKQYNKPVVFTEMFTGAFRRGEVYDELEGRHMHPYPTPERAARAIAHLVEYSEYLNSTE